MFPLMLHSRELERGYGTLNYIAHKNPEVDKAIEQAEQTMDVPARSKLYAEAGRHALADHVTVPLWFFYAVNATRKNLTVESRADASLTPMTIRQVAAAAANGAAMGEAQVRKNAIAARVCTAGGAIVARAGQHSTAKTSTPEVFRL